MGPFSWILVDVTCIFQILVLLTIVDFLQFPAVFHPGTVSQLEFKVLPLFP